MRIISQRGAVAVVSVVSVCLATCSRDGGSAKPPVAASIPPATVKAIDVAVGDKHICVLLSTHEVQCWGDNRYGQLGQGHTQTSSTAVPVRVGALVQAITAGGSTTCALTEAGAVRCWGSGFSGVLGYAGTNDVGDDEVPAQAGDVPLTGPARFVSTSADSTCAVLEGRHVECWGGGKRRESWTFAQEVMEAAESCALLKDGTVSCWHVLSSDDRPNPPTRAEAPWTMPSVAGAQHLTRGNCAATAAGRVFCWHQRLIEVVWTETKVEDYSSVGQIEQADDESAYAHLAEAGVGREYGAFEGPLKMALIAVGRGDDTTCSLAHTGEVYCFGSSRSGALGVPGSPAVGASDAVRVDVGGKAVRISSSGARTCVVTEHGGVRCWGYGGDGLLGYGTTENVGETRTPAQAGDVPLAMSGPPVTASPATSTGARR